MAAREPHPNQRARASLPRELWRTGVPATARAWVERVAGSRVVQVRRLAGASSTAIHSLALADGQRLVLRRYVWPGFLDSEPDAPRREVDALRFASQQRLAVPHLIAADVAGDEVGDGIPALLMTRLAGRAVAVPALGALADVLVTIHAVDASDLGHDWFPWYDGTTLGPPPGAGSPQLWERAIAIWRESRPPFEPVFVHRDFHPGNVLWSRGALTGIVDWANACRGPGGCDVAHCRWNLQRLADDATADRFQREYETRTGILHDPYWDLASTLEHGPSQWTPANIAAAEPRLARAVAALG